MGFIFRNSSGSNERPQSAGRAKPPVARATSSSAGTKPTPVAGQVLIESIIVLFAKGGGIDLDKAKDALARSAPDVAVGFIFDTAAAADGADNHFGITIGAVTWSFMYIDAPAPCVDEMIQTTRMDKDKLRALGASQAHGLLMNLEKREVSVDELSQLFVVLGELLAQQGVGIILTDSWQSLHADDVRNWVANGVVRQVFEKKMAKSVLCNLIPFFGDGGTWWATKGNHCFRVPDFALWVDEGVMGREQVANVLYYLFDYLQGGAVIKFGDTLGLGDKTLVAGPVTEFADFIAGKEQTIAFRFR